MNKNINQEQIYIKRKTIEQVGRSGGDLCWRRGRSRRRRPRLAGALQSVAAPRLLSAPKHTRNKNIRNKNINGDIPNSYEPEEREGKVEDKGGGQEDEPRLSNDLVGSFDLN